MKAIYLSTSTLWRWRDQDIRAWSIIDSPESRFPATTVFMDWPVPIYIWACGHARSGKGYEDVRSRNDSKKRFVVMMVTAGDAQVESTAGKMVVGAGEVFFIHPDRDTSWRTGSSGILHHRYVEIAGPSLDSILRSTRLHEYDRVRPVSAARLCALMKSANRIIGEKKDEYRYELGLYAFSILIELTRSVTCTKYPPPVARALSYMNDHIFSDVTNTELAEASRVSVSRLGELFRTHLHCSPITMYLQMKMEHAKELLLHRDKSVKEVAYVMGYENHYYFSRLFKKVTGTTAWEFRQTAREKQ
jgi:AraC-like DNA-binding protein